jgi:glycosyltransferase involved in cell wall biosynthesis
MYPTAVRDLSRQLARHHRAQPIDLLISTSSAAIKGLRAPPGVPHLCYCHCPARYVWSRMDEYTSAGGLGALGLKLFGRRFRAWDRTTASNVTHFIANSTYTQGEIQASYGRDSSVVHPPADTAFFTTDETIDREDHWLVVSALEPYKRVDLAIDAAKRARHPLTIVGDGTQRASLEKRAGPTVSFAGRIDNEQLRSHYQRARLLIFPQIEDFGIIAVEAQACGCPVVARDVGGSRDTVLRDQTGSFFSEPTANALLDAIARCPNQADAACRSNALRFSTERFIRKIEAQIESALAPHD